MYLYLLCLVTSFCSFAYEMILFKEVSYISNGDIIAQALVLSFYLMAMGYGAYKAQNKRPDHLLVVEKGLIFSPFYFSFFLIANYFSVHLFEYEKTMNSIPYMSLYVFYLSVMMTSAVLGFLTGMELPLLLKIKERSSSKMIALSYFGTLLASSYLIYFQNNLFYVWILNVLLLVYFKYYFREKKYVVFFFILGANILIFNFNDSIYVQTKELEYKAKIIENFRTPYQEIDLVQYNTDEIRLYANGQFQFSSKNEKDYHQALVDKYWNPVFKDVLVLGAGDGLVLRELKKYKDINVSHVELDKYFYNWSKDNNFMKLINDKSLKGNVVFQDAFIFVKESNDKYDYIIIDFPYPSNLDLSKLYTYEFYKNIYFRLNNNGIVVLDAPVRDTKNIVYKEQKVLNNVLKANIERAGFDVEDFYVGEEGFLVLKKQKEDITYNNFRRLDDFDSLFDTYFLIHKNRNFRF